MNYKNLLVLFGIASIKIKKSKKKLFFLIFIMNYSAIKNKSKKWLQIIWYSLIFKNILVFTTILFKMLVINCKFQTLTL